MFNGNGADMPPSMVMPKKTNDLGDFNFFPVKSAKPKFQTAATNSKYMTIHVNSNNLLFPLQIHSNSGSAGPQLLMSQGKCP